MHLGKYIVTILLLLSGVLTLDSINASQQSLGAKVLHERHKLEVMEIRRNNLEQKKEKLQTMNQSMRQKLHPFDKEGPLLDQQAIVEQLKMGETELVITQKDIQNLKEQINVQRTYVQSLKARLTRRKN